MPSVVSTDIFLREMSWYTNVQQVQKAIPSLSHLVLVSILSQAVAHSFSVFLQEMFLEQGAGLNDADEQGNFFLKVWSVL
jgi:hypothetical protein